MNIMHKKIAILVLILATTAILQCASAEETVLRIGTQDVVKSASLLGDSSMGVFAHLSNPPLMKMNPDGTLSGQTAKSYSVSEDGMTWRFEIDDNLYWSDGTKLTPEDVKFTFEYISEKYPPAGWIKNTVDEISVDGNAVVFKLNKPYSRLNLEFTTYNILPKHVWENIEKPTEYTNEGPMIGCGPFVIEKTDLGAGVIYFKRNPYWKGKEPKIDSIELHMYENADVLSMALEKGDVDAYYKYAGTYPYTGIQKLKDTGNFDFVEKDNVGLVFLGFNLNKEPMSDLQFREAMAYAINYTEILKIDALGYGSVPNRGFVPPSMAYFKDTPALKYDPKKARESLEEAGYRDGNGNGILEDPSGNDVKLLLLARSKFQRVAELVKEYISAVGIDVELKVVDDATWIKLKDEYQYDLTITRTTPWGMMMHANWGTGYFDSRRTGEGVLHVLSDPEFQKLCDDILAATSDEELEEYAYMLQDYYAENLPGIALYWNKVFTPYNKRWTGWNSDPLYGIYNLDNFLNVERVA
ncbi:ABC transporter substrate-binding protein [Methanothrix thermoacetophila]|uniref:Extracellular solute-binding protein, family 5 n=1 Tax=Methanothrix thermoacetophila (strain DSM 6194 / JCM 14653 / NBRC 101360 / PT) TaxID=349307 RepID=A0B7Z8_METTP|nr:ABC transporter substrate-binding protein [Methanothrix thermoacetophila]ABK14822.1 extracellular solute-binding protein, family 5 [Methanothrix thermoacetophila PT]